MYRSEDIPCACGPYYDPKTFVPYCKKSCAIRHSINFFKHYDDSYKCIIHKDLACPLFCRFIDFVCGEQYYYLELKCFSCRRLTPEPVLNDVGIYTCKPCHLNKINTGKSISPLTTEEQLVICPKRFGLLHSWWERFMETVPYLGDRLNYLHQCLAYPRVYPRHAYNIVKMFYKYPIKA